MYVHSRTLGARYCSSSSSGGHPMHPQGEQLSPLLLLCSHKATGNCGACSSYRSPCLSCSGVAGSRVMKLSWICSICKPDNRSGMATGYRSGQICIWDLYKRHTTGETGEAVCMETWSNHFQPLPLLLLFLSLYYINIKFSLGAHVHLYSSVTRRTCWCPTTYNGHWGKSTFVVAMGQHSRQL